MEKRIWAILIATFVVVALSVASIAGSDVLTTSSDEVESPLFTLRAAMATGDGAVAGEINYLGQGENMGQSMACEDEAAMMHYAPNTSLPTTPNCVCTVRTCEGCTFLYTNCWPLCHTYNFPCTVGIICGVGTEEQYAEVDMAESQVQPIWGP